MALSLAYHTLAAPTISAASGIDTPTAMLSLSLRDKPALDGAEFCDSGVAEPVWEMLDAGCDDGGEAVGLGDVLVFGSAQTNAADPMPFPVVSDKQVPTFPLLMGGQKVGFPHCS